MEPTRIVKKATKLREKIDDAEYEMSFIQRNLRKNQHKLAKLVEAYGIEDCKGVHPSCPCYECHDFRVRKEELVQDKNSDYDYIPVCMGEHPLCACLDCEDFRHK